MHHVNITNFFIISEKRYICQVIKKGNEEWYIMNSNKLIKMKLYYYLIVDENNTIIFLENRNNIIKFEIRYKNDNIKYIRLQKKKCKKIEDKSLYNLFYDIYRMKKSNYIKEK